MYAQFDNDELISISGLKQPATFFAQLSKLLPSDECVIGLGCFVPDKQVGEWLHNLPAVIIPQKYDFKRSCEVSRENLQGGAFYLRATALNLTQLARFGTLVKSPEFLCSHVIGFLGEASLFSFHDAFSYDDMLVSPIIPEAKVKAFCVALEARYKKIANPQQR